MRILLVGATGLVGQGVLHECLAARDVDAVTLLVRRAPAVADARVDVVQVADFADLSAVEARLRPFDACLYCAGATPFVTPEPEYRHVTVDLTLSVARTFARLNPDGRFIYVSGAKADPRSALMPMRVKGDAERALAALPVRTVMVRPGGVRPVLGERSPHRALALLYRFGGPAMGVAAAAMPGLMTTTARLGRALLELARMPDPPAVVENRDINRLGG